ncbi:MAG: 2OG-Fe(II) oxygenase family protein, partial [Cyanobacteriota bacterium]
RQGRLLEAEKVLVQSPGTSTRADLITNLAILSCEHGRVARARTFYLQALELEPQSFVPAYNLARFYFLHGDMDRAHEAVIQALVRAPQAKEGYQLLEQIESGRGDFQAALVAIDQWCRFHPNDLAPQIAQCRILATTGDHQRLTECLSGLVSRCPGHPDLLALLSGLPSELRQHQGLSAAVSACFDPELQVRHRLSVVPEGLCRQLEQMILSDPTLHAHRPHKPSRRGSQTHELFADPLPDPLEALVTILIPHLQEMLAGFNQEQRQSLALPLPTESLCFSGWGVVLESGGYQAPHVHPESLFSGVVYLKIPAFNQSQLPDNLHRPGSLCFYGNGVNEAADLDSAALAHQRATLSVLPGRGDVVFFPSFLWHGTVPFVADDSRICLAFNVLPKLGSL